MSSTIVEVNGKRYRVTNKVQEFRNPYGVATVTKTVTHWELLPSATQLDLFNG
jgi:hypothetical protein